MKGSSSLSSVLRKYYDLAAKALGLQDTKDGIRAGKESQPIGSLAAFTFTEPESPNREEKTDLKEDEKPSASSKSSKGIKRSGSRSFPHDVMESKPSKSAKRD